MKRIVSFLILAALTVTVFLLPAAETPPAPSHPSVVSPYNPFRIFGRVLQQPGLRHV